VLQGLLELREQLVRLGLKVQQVLLALLVLKELLELQAHKVSRANQGMLLTIHS
jgi:hypothetical protein